MFFAHFRHHKFYIFINIIIICCLSSLHLYHFVGLSDIISKHSNEKFVWKVVTFHGDKDVSLQLNVSRKQAGSFEN